MYQFYFFKDFFILKNVHKWGMGERGGGKQTPRRAGSPCGLELTTLTS